MMRIRRMLPLLVALGMIYLTACGGGGSAGDGRPAGRSATPAVDDPAGARASAACAAQVRTLRLVTEDIYGDVARAGAAAMRRAHPGLTVDVVADAHDDPSLAAAIRADRAAGRGVDVAAAGLAMLPEMAGDLGAQPLSARSLRASYDQRALGLGTVAGRLVGIPTQLTTLALVYNQDLLERAGVDPKTLSDTDGVLAAAERIRATAGGIQPLDVITDGQQGQLLLATLANSRGIPLQDDVGRPTLTTAATREAAAFLARIGGYGPQPDLPILALARFGPRRQTAMLAMDLRALTGNLKIVAGDGARGPRIGMVPFPVLPGGTFRPVAQGSALSVLATDRCQREMATELVVTLLSPEFVADDTRASSSIPLDTAAVGALSAFYTTYPQLRVFLGTVGSLVRPPSWGGALGGQVAGALSGQVARLLRGADPTQSLAAAQTEAENLTR
nr:extracellular solute-binding protein [Candidatus Frankia nodulisporulans]